MNFLRKIFSRCGCGPPGPHHRADAPSDLHQLEKRIGYSFRDSSVLMTALVHRSLASSDDQDQAVSNQRLEFLGDAVLNLFVSTYLYRTFPEKREGDLTKIKSLIVSRTVLADKAKTLHLGQYLRLGAGEEQSGGRFRTSILADAFEALLGAMYIDGGERVVAAFLETILLHDLDHLINAEEHTNYKSLLLEHCQAQGQGQPVYRVSREQGPDHQKEFTVTVSIKGSVSGTGTGGNKREAEQRAAREALEQIHRGN